MAAAALGFRSSVRCWPQHHQQLAMTKAPPRAANVPATILPCVHAAAARCASSPHCRANQVNEPVHRRAHHEHSSFPEHHRQRRDKTVARRKVDLCCVLRGQTACTTEVIAQAPSCPFPRRLSRSHFQPIAPRQPASTVATARSGATNSIAPQRISDFAQSGFNEVA